MTITVSVDVKDALSGSCSRWWWISKGSECGELCKCCVKDAREGDLEKSLIDHEYEIWSSHLRLQSITAVWVGGRWGWWGIGSHVYANVSSVTFDSEKNKVMNEGSRHASLLNVIHVETTHTWLGDFSSHGNSTAKMGLPGKRQSVKRGRRRRAELRKNKLVEAGVLCTAHVCFFNTKINKISQLSEQTKAIKSTTNTLEK